MTACGSLIPFAWHEQIRCERRAGHDGDHWCQDTGWEQERQESRSGGSGALPAGRAAVTLRSPEDGALGTLIGPADKLAALVRPDAVVPSGEPCRVYSHGSDGWHCAVTGPHTEHRNAAGDASW